jgi:hypothetical protein
VVAEQQEIALVMVVMEQQLEMEEEVVGALILRLMVATAVMELFLVGEEAEVAAEQQATLVQAAMEQVVMFVFGLGKDE